MDAVLGKIFDLVKKIVNWAGTSFRDQKLIAEILDYVQKLFNK